MHGDFSRVTFHGAKHYTAVLAQQGRVTLDADLNEQTTIVQQQLRELLADLLGPHGGPVDNCGFAISFPLDPTGQPRHDDLTIGPGRYYVNGLPATSPGSTFWTQPDAYLDQVADRTKLPDPPYLVYLDAQELLVTAIQDPALREVALGDLAPDTSVRSRLSWQVHAVRELRAGSTLIPLTDVTGTPQEIADKLEDKWTAWQSARANRPVGLRARAQRPADAHENPCTADPESRYRGLENQLYRVEIHRTGVAGPDLPATFKWSRENGSVTFPIARAAGNRVQLTRPGRDHKLALDIGDWVEVVDDAYAARNTPAPLLQVTAVDPDRQGLTLSGQLTTTGLNQARHPYLRRWDQRPAEPPATDPLTPATPKPHRATDNAITLVEKTWIALEDGVEIEFTEDGRYETGDYWLIPARAITGDVEWPEEGRQPVAQRPHGPEHHLAPLAFIAPDHTIHNTRRRFTAGATPFPLDTPEKATRRPRT
ncbi:MULTISPECIES: DUF6519 domain-containing protein [unclassified Crossiella]|uniref:DUF6519 domain-containing protein n=1 Tax=unclassified Crossiella TaxID=2620835 RepID=UPI0020001EE8|nr:MULTISPECIES: DUF6519 domain-containing protein [unclassified Crossiella]MCK2242814.1 DUF4815 domain-containing protein [Crossiella sp. S99.2]MCK2256691.1 DUF4815 domain-containing protein [Crossiella sp. S99.1]